GRPGEGRGLLRDRRGTHPRRMRRCRLLGARLVRQPHHRRRRQSRIFRPGNEGHAMKRVPISFEFFPPNTPVGDEKLKTVVQDLGAMQPEFFSVTYGAGGSTREKTLKTVVAICQAGHEAAPHVSCVGATRAGLAEILATYRAE